MTTADDEMRPFFFAIDDIPAYSIAEMLEQSDVDDEETQRLYGIFGRDLMTKVILQSPNLCVYHEEAQPGENVKPHRHGTHQITHVLRGSLHYGNRVTSRRHGLLQPRPALRLDRGRRRRGVDRDPRRPTPGLRRVVLRPFWSATARYPGTHADQNAGRCRPSATRRRRCLPARRARPWPRR